MNRFIKICINCKKQFLGGYRTKTCSSKCRTGKFASHWKGGRKFHQRGYVLIYKPEHPFCNTKGYVAEHRLVVENNIGRYLKPTEIVHHNGERFQISSKENMRDNRIENLTLCQSQAEHFAIHKEYRRCIKLSAERGR